jgi:hypothetical protein
VNDPFPTPGGNSTAFRAASRDMAPPRQPAYVRRMPKLTLGTILLGAAVLVSPVRAEERPVTTNKVHKKEQQFEQELKTERDRPAKKERAKAAAGRVEDGVRDFGRGLQGVMKEAGIGDGPPTGPKKAEGKPAKPAVKTPPAPPPAKTPPASKPSAPPAK